MEHQLKIKLGLTTAVIAAGCVSAVYLVWRNKNKFRDASDALSYMNVTVVTDQTLCDEVVKELRRRSKQHHAIGFDCEWVSDKGRRHPVALIQLSSFDGYCVLLRLNKMKTFPDSLKELLEDKNIYKVGVAPGDDAKNLLQDYSVYLRSSLDLRHLALLNGYAVGGLAALTISHLSIMLDKHWKVRCSNWEADELSNKQVIYAAADAHVAIKLFVKFINDLNKLNMFRFLSGSKIWNNLEDTCEKYLDIAFKGKNNIKIKLDTAHNKNKNGNKDVIAMSKSYPHATRSKPLYHNCFLQAPDGELLCTCDKKKAFWYIEKGLAEKVTDDPLTVRLRFEPAGRAVGSVGRYYKLAKENKCVVCGNAESYIRKNVVPREYRKYFPEIMKDHSSHDVVLLCVRCHQQSNIFDLKIREMLAKMCNAPLASQDCSKYKEDADNKKIRSAARALYYQSRKHVLPDARRKELEDLLLQYYPDQDEVTQELLEEAINITVVVEKADYEIHGLKVVEHFLQHEGLLRLEEYWREHFLNSMEPKYMPELWSVKHNEERLRVKFNEGRLPEKDLKLLGLTK